MIGRCSSGSHGLWDALGVLFLLMLLIATHFLVVCLLGSDWPDSSSLGSCVTKILKPLGKQLPLSPSFHPTTLCSAGKPTPYPPRSGAERSVPAPDAEAVNPGPTFVPSVQHVGTLRDGSCVPGFDADPKAPHSAIGTPTPPSDSSARCPSPHTHTDSRKLTAFSLLSLH